MLPDIVALPSGWIAAFRVPHGPLSVLWLTATGETLERQDIAIGADGDSSFARLTIFQGRPFLAYRAFRSNVWCAVVREISGGVLAEEHLAGIVHQPDDAFGNCPVCLSSDGWFAWQDAETLSVEGLRLDTAEHRTLRSELRPTGLATCAGGVIVFEDDIRTSVPGMLFPVTAGDCTVGEGLSGGVAVVFTDGHAGVLLPGDGNCTDPRVAANAGAYAVVMWGAQGVRLLLFVSADVQQPAPVPPTPTPTPPIPSPTPTPKPTPISTPPAPVPVPVPAPKGPSVLYIYTSANSLAVEECQRIDNTNGTVSAQRTKDGLYLSRDSGGAVKWASAIGSDEQFSIVGKGLVSKNYFPDPAHATFYAFPFIEG
jgi:hypothetical protein